MVRVKLVMADCWDNGTSSLSRKTLDGFPAIAGVPFPMLFSVAPRPVIKLTHDLAP